MFAIFAFWYLRIYLWIKNEGGESEVFLCMCELLRVSRPVPSPRSPRRVTILCTTHHSCPTVSSRESRKEGVARNRQGRKVWLGRAKLPAHMFAERENSPRTKGPYNRFQEQSKNGNDSKGLLMSQALLDTGS